MSAAGLAHQRAVTAEMRWADASAAARALLTREGVTAAEFAAAARDLQAAADDLAAATAEFKQAMR